MPSPNPSDMKIAGIALNTNAAANTIDTNVAVVPAPSTNSRNRLWAAKLTGLPARTGALWASIENSSGTVIVQLSCVAKGGDFIFIPCGVITGTSIRIRESSDVATQSIRVD